VLSTTQVISTLKKLNMNLEKKIEILLFSEKALNIDVIIVAYKFLSTVINSYRNISYIMT